MKNNIKGYHYAYIFETNLLSYRLLPSTVRLKQDFVSLTSTDVRKEMNPMFHVNM